MVSHKLRLRFITQLKSVKCHLEFHQLYWWESPFCSEIINRFLMLLCRALPGLAVCHNELCSWMQPISSPGQRVGKEEGIQEVIQRDVLNCV